MEVVLVVDVILVVVVLLVVVLFLQVFVCFQFPSRARACFLGRSDFLAGQKVSPSGLNIFRPVRYFKVVILGKNIKNKVLLGWSKMVHFKPNI